MDKFPKSGVDYFDLNINAEHTVVGNVYGFSGKAGEMIVFLRISPEQSEKLLETEIIGVNGPLCEKSYRDKSRKYGYKVGLFTSPDQLYDLLLISPNQNIRAEFMLVGGDYQVNLHHNMSWGQYNSLLEIQKVIGEKVPLRNLQHGALFFEGQNTTNMYMYISREASESLCGSGIVENFNRDYDEFPLSTVMFSTGIRPGVHGITPNGFYEDATVKLAHVSYFDRDFKAFQKTYVAVVKTLLDKGFYFQVDKETYSKAHELDNSVFLSNAGFGLGASVSCGCPYCAAGIPTSQSVKIGTEQKPATAEDIAAIQEQLAKTVADPNLLVFEQHRVVDDILQGLLFRTEDKTTKSDRSMIRTREANIYPCISNLNSMLSSIELLEKWGFPDDVSMAAFLKLKPHIKACLKAVKNIKQEKP